MNAESEGNGVVFTVSREDDELARRTLDDRNLTMNPQSLELIFNNDGSLASGSDQSIAFSSTQSTAQACVFASGFPFAGSCDDAP